MQVDFAVILKNENGDSKKFGSADKIDWCGLIKPSKSAVLKNMFAKKLIQEFKTILPKEVLTCPLTGIIEMKNVSVKFELMKMLPKGLYIVRFKAADKKIPVAVNASIHLQVTQ